MPWPPMIMMSPMMIAAPNFADKKSSIITAMMFFIYPSFIFIILAVLKFKFYGTDPIWWAAAIFLSGMVVALLYRLPSQLYNTFTGIANYGYFIKDASVYLDGKKIMGADANTFTHFNNRGYYSKDKNHVYYNASKLKNADATTFQPLANDNSDSYWHDKSNVYYKWNFIEGADGASFEYAGYLYAYDKNNVFFENTLLQGADRTTFKPIQTFVGRDAKNIFIRNVRATNIKDFSTFEMITQNEFEFGRDKYQVYMIKYIESDYLVPFPDADPETFEVLGENYAKDRHRVYYYTYQEIAVLENAIPETFVLHYDSIKNTDATDGIRYYKFGVLHVEQENI